MNKNYIMKWRKQEILKKTSYIKEFIQKNSCNPQLLEDIINIEQYIIQQKKGLNFEDHPEDFIEDSTLNNFTFTELKELSISMNGNENYLIEGENLITLFLLKHTYHEKIDVICIDPPYNTGNLKLKYNDSDFIDFNDEYSHSKWLSFMEKRLKIAYELLSPHGIMYINIDETQIGCLILLCEQIFGESNITILIWPKMDPKYDQNRIKKPVNNVKIAHEYVLLCYKEKSNTQLNKIIKRPNHSDFNVPEQPAIMETILFELGTTSSAKDELYDIFGNREIFSTPKPCKMIKEFVRAATGKDAIILDIFAGSGTTGQAVMELNQEDKGNRRFILITNNENNICREITYERLKRVINKAQYKENLKYLLIESIKPI